MTLRTRSIGAAIALALCSAIVGCESPDPDSGTTSKAMEQRMREIEKRMKDSMPKTQQIALAQKPDPEVVRKVQDQLKALNEYLEPAPSGKIDMVTVNAIEAFQRRAGLKEDGLLDEETLKKLDEAAKAAQAAPTANPAG
jgi:peptidoglycan hydrolase-like protein with peptidoglycan-binding domain